jgi:predicted transposase/invertase (TIGR01784 family)
MDKINNVHDKVFKKMFGDVTIAKNFLQSYLPNEILKITDLENLTYEKESYLDEKLKAFYSDLLFKTNINGKESYIYLLIEHKSYIDNTVAIQILEYIIKIWKLKMKDNKVPLLIPLLVYHGKQKWNVDKNLNSLVEGIGTLPQEITKYIPNYNYLVYDLSSFTDEQIRGEAVLRILIRLYININKDKGDIKHLVTEAGRALEELFDKNKGYEFFEVFVRYVMAVKDLNNIEDIIDEDDPDGRSEFIMTLAEKLMNEGMEKGIRQEKINTALKLKKLGAEIEFISKATELSIKELEELFKANESK